MAARLQARWNPVNWDMPRHRAEFLLSCWPFIPGTGNNSVVVPAGFPQTPGPFTLLTIHPVTLIVTRDVFSNWSSASRTASKIIDTLTFDSHEWKARFCCWGVSIILEAVCQFTFRYDKQYVDWLKGSTVLCIYFEWSSGQSCFLRSSFLLILSFHANIKSKHYNRCPHVQRKSGVSCF